MKNSIEYTYVIMIVEDVSLSETYRSTFDHLLIDRSDQDLSIDDRICWEISG